MKRVYIGNNYATTPTGAPVAPMRVIGPVEIVARLTATRSGANANWKIILPEEGIEFLGHKGPWLPTEIRRRLGLNDAPHRPMLRAVAERFIWCPPDTRDCPAPSLLPFVEGEDGLPLILRTGSLEVNWAAAIRGPLPDPVREALEERAKGSWAPFATQGRLEVLRATHVVPEEELPFLRTGSGNARLLNHYIIAHDGFACRVIGGRYTAMVRIRQGQHGWILSPDHPDEPIELVGRNRDEIFLLRHPIPGAERD